MRSALVDTNVLIAFVEKGGKALAEQLSKYDELVVSPVVLGEYRAGISNTKRGRESQAALERFLESDSVREVELTGKTSIYYAKIFQDLKSKGKPIPVNDMWIASTALERGLELCSFDDHFSNIAMLQFVKLPSPPIP